MARGHARGDGGGPAAGVAALQPPGAEKRGGIRLTDETGDDGIAGGFVAAEKFHKNFYHDEMEDFEIEHDRPLVHRFVARVLTLLNN